MPRARTQSDITLLLHRRASSLHYILRVEKDVNGPAQVWGLCKIQGMSINAFMNALVNVGSGKGGKHGKK